MGTGADSDSVSSYDVENNYVVLRRSVSEKISCPPNYTQDEAPAVSCWVAASPPPPNFYHSNHTLQMIDEPDHLHANRGGNEITNLSKKFSRWARIREVLIKTVISETERKKQEDAKKGASKMSKLRKSFTRTSTMTSGQSGQTDRSDDAYSSGDDLPGQANREGKHRRGRPPSWSDDLSSSSCWSSSSSSTVVSLHECWDDHEIVEDFSAWRWKNDEGRMIQAAPEHNIPPGAPGDHVPPLAAGCWWTTTQQRSYSYPTRTDDSRGPRVHLMKKFLLSGRCREEQFCQIEMSVSRSSSRRYVVEEVVEETRFLAAPFGYYLWGLSSWVIVMLCLCEETNDCDVSIIFNKQE